MVLILHAKGVMVVGLGVESTLTLLVWMDLICISVDLFLDFVSHQHVYYLNLTTHVVREGTYRCSYTFHDLTETSTRLSFVYDRYTLYPGSNPNSSIIHCSTVFPLDELDPEGVVVEVYGCVSVWC